KDCFRRPPRAFRKGSIRSAAQARALMERQAAAWPDFAPGLRRRARVLPSARALAAPALASPVSSALSVERIQRLGVPLAQKAALALTDARHLDRATRFTFYIVALGLWSADNVV